MFLIFPKKIVNMQKIKFLLLLKKVTQQELEGFHKHLKRYHPREKIALQVFEYLIRFYPDFEPKEKLRLEYAYQRIFKTDIYKSEHAQKKMLNTASDLNKWLKNFLIVSKTQQNHRLQQMIWLSILQERDMKDEFARTAAAFYEEMRDAPFKTASDTLPISMASYFHREHLSSYKPLTHIHAIQQCTDTMAECWEIMRLKMACEMSLVKRSAPQVPAYPIKEPSDFQQVGLSVLKNIYDALWRLTDSGEERHFARLESQLKQHGQHLDPKELEWIIPYAYNFTAEQSRHNQDPIHYERMHRLNKIGLEYGVFFRDGYWPSTTFGNFVLVACLSKDFEWASGFIRDCSHIILEHDRPKAILLAKALLAFETDKFQEVQYLLESVEFEAHLDILRANSLLLRSYYELQADQHRILDTCAHFENLLRRSAKTEADKAMLAFTLILKRLTTQKSSKKVIVDLIESAPALYSKKWLLEKTAHYKARYADRKRASGRHTRASI